MPQRITIMLEDELVKKIRTIQAKKIKDSTASVSFSRVINQLLHETTK